MLRSCVVCKAGASPVLQLQYCARCQSALYCSRTCQRKDWKKQHKKICKFLNVGHGDMQVRTNDHTNRQIELNQRFERDQQFLDENTKQFFKLFTESTFEGSQSAAVEMKKYAKQHTKHNQKFLLFHSLHLLVRSDSEMLLWPNSPLLVMLQFVDPDVLNGDEDVPVEEDETSETPLHHLADLADPFDYSSHVNQLILAKQLIEYGADVNAVSKPHGKTPLHNACFIGVVTNLDFVELLLKEGADPNARTHMGQHLGLTPLMCSSQGAPGVAKFLLDWPSTDANITSRSGVSFLPAVRAAVTSYSGFIAEPDNPEQVQHQFQLQQWRDIEKMMVEMGAR
jgi:uncharacterized phage-like protein YoqJ